MIPCTRSLLSRAPLRFHHPTANAFVASSLVIGLRPSSSRISLSSGAWKARSPSPGALGLLNIARRSYQHLANPPPKSTNVATAEAQPQRPTPTTPPVAGQAKPASQDPTEHTEVSNAEQRRSDWKIIRQLLIHVWPKNDWRTRGTVFLGFAFLITGKVCDVSLSFSGAVTKENVQVLNVQVPLIFKDVVDSLNIDPSTTSTVWLVCGSMILGCTLPCAQLCNIF
jgi:hypothetical protein